jgi:hypothetical protein
VLRSFVLDLCLGVLRSGTDVNRDGLPTFARQLKVRNASRFTSSGTDVNRDGLPTFVDSSRYVMRPALPPPEPT